MQPDKKTVQKRRSEKKRRRRQERYKKLLATYYGFFPHSKGRRRWYHYFYVPIYSNYDRLMFQKAVDETRLRPINGYAKRHWYITEATKNKV